MIDPNLLNLGHCKERKPANPQVGAAAAGSSRGASLLQEAPGHSSDRASARREVTLLPALRLPLQVYDPAARVRLYEESAGVLEQITGKALPNKLRA
jgi:hypothetical protein